MKVVIIGLHGPAFSGKDSAANLLRCAARNDVAVIEGRFAEPVYQMIRTRLPSAYSGMSKAEKEKGRRELGGLSVRQLALAIAEGSRKFDKNVWANIWQASLTRQLQQLKEDGHSRVLVLVPDLRMEHERDAILRAVSKDRDLEVIHQILHIRPVGSESVDNPCPVTEAGLQVLDGEIIVTNDHSMGLKGFTSGLLGGLLQDKHISNHFFELFESSRPLGEVANMAEKLAEKNRDYWRHQARLVA